MIYITGDTHGDFDALERRLDFAKRHQGIEIKDEDILIICGDFGFIFGEYMKEEYKKLLDNIRFTVAFVDGNHEDFPQIYSYPVEEWNGGTIHRIAPNIVHLMRGQVFDIDGKTFFTLGGAYSMDASRRVIGDTMWYEELPNVGEYQNATDNLAAHGDKVDYILTHTAPQSAIRKLGIEPDMHDIELTAYLEWLLHRVEFRHWYFGHFHLNQNINEKMDCLYFSIVPIE